jgi:hypothetical protein
MGHWQTLSLRDKVRLCHSDDMWRWGPVMCWGQAAAGMCGSRAKAALASGLPKPWGTLTKVTGTVGETKTGKLSNSSSEVPGELGSRPGLLSSAQRVYRTDRIQPNPGRHC